MPLSARGVVAKVLLSVYTGTLSINADNFENELLYKLIIMLNKPHFSLLYAN